MSLAGVGRADGTAHAAGHVMHTDDSRDRVLEAERGKKPKTAAPVAVDPDGKAAPPATSPKPSLSQIEQERADDEGMTKPSDD
jgi:hypothetical protein